MPDPNQVLQQATADGKSPEFLAELRSQLGLVDEAINLPENIELKNERNSLVEKMEKDQVSSDYQKAILKQFDEDSGYAKNAQQVRDQAQSKEALAKIYEITGLEAPTEDEIIEEKARHGEITSTNNIYDKGLSGGELEEKGKREEEQKLLELGVLPPQQSVLNTMTNLLGNFATVDDRLKYAYGLLTASDSAKSLATTLISTADPKSILLGRAILAGGEKAIGEAETELRKQEELHNKGTIGFTDVPNQKGGLAQQGLAAGAAGINAVMAFVSSAAENAIPGLLWADIASTSIRDYNKEKANELGISVEELLENGQSEILAPLASSGIVFLLEKSGIEKVTGKTTSKWLRNAKPGVMRLLGQIGEAAFVEGGTEWIQGGVEQWSLAQARNEDVLDRFTIAADWLVSKEGRETFYQGAFGGKAIRVPSAIKEMQSDRRSEADKKVIEDTNKEIVTLNNMRQNPNLSDEELLAIDQAEAAALKKRGDAIINPYVDLINVNEGGINEIKTLNDQIRNISTSIIAAQNSETMSQEEKDLMIKSLEFSISQKEAEALQIIALSNQAKEEADKTLLDKVRQRFKDKKKESRKTKEGEQSAPVDTFADKQEEEAAVDKAQSEIETERSEREADAIEDLAEKMDNPSDRVKDVIQFEKRLDKAQEEVDEHTEVLKDLHDKKAKGEITPEEYSIEFRRVLAERKKSSDVIFDKYGRKKQPLFNDKGDLNEDIFDTKSNSTQFNKANAQNSKDTTYSWGSKQKHPATDAELSKLIDDQYRNKTTIDSPHLQALVSLYKAAWGVDVIALNFKGTRAEGSEGFSRIYKGTPLIVLNDKGFSRDTAMHEMGHFLTPLLKQYNPELYAEFENRVLNSEGAKHFRDLYFKRKNFKGSIYENNSKEQDAQEIMSIALGVLGESRFGKGKSTIEIRSIANKVVDFFLDFIESLGVNVSKLRAAQYSKLKFGDIVDVINSEGVSPGALTKISVADRKAALVKAKKGETKNKEDQISPDAGEAIEILLSATHPRHVRERVEERAGVNYEQFLVDNHHKAKIWKKGSYHVDNAINDHGLRVQDIIRKSEHRPNGWQERLAIDLEAAKQLKSKVPVEVIRQLRQDKYADQVIIEYRGEGFIFIDPKHNVSKTFIDHQSEAEFRFNKAAEAPNALNESESKLVNKSVKSLKDRVFKESKQYESKPIDEAVAKNPAASTIAEQEQWKAKAIQAIDNAKKILAKKGGKHRKTDFGEKTSEEMLLGFSKAFQNITGGEPAANLLINTGANIITQDIENKDEQLQINGVIGSLIFNEMEDLGVLEYETGWKSADPYTVGILNEDAWDAVLRSQDFDPTVENDQTQQPHYEKIDHFEGFSHKTGLQLFKKAHKSVKEVGEKVLQQINNAMDTPMAVDTGLLTALENLISKIKPENKSKLRLFENTMRMARKVGEKTYYSMYRYDFRGRIYPTISYLSHQGTDMAKALIRVARPKPLGEGGWKWLLVQMADTYGADEVTLEDRFTWSDDNLEDLMAIAADPVGTHDKWENLEEPFLFLATAMEVKRAIDSGDPMSYRSNMPIHMDATTSGPQIMAAITRDQVAGETVNLLDKKERGDLYTAVAEKINDWIGAPTAAEEKSASIFNEKIIGLKDNIKNAENKELWQAANKVFYDFVKDKGNADAKKVAARVFMNKIPRDKFRKIMKGPVMTKYYSAGEKTVAGQLLKKFAGEPGFEGFDYTYAFEVSKQIFNELDGLLVGPGKLMKQIATIGKTLANQGKPMRLTLPVNGFVMHQEPKVREEGNFRVGHRSKNKDVMRKSPNGVIKFVFNYADTDKIDSSKATSSAAPNFIHSIDALIPAWLLLNTDYGVLTIHDSFGTVAGESQALYKDIRQSFKEIAFDNDIIKSFFEENFDQAQADKYNNKVVRGTLTGDGVLANEFAFSAGKGIHKNKKLTPIQKHEIADKLAKEAEQVDLKDKIDTILEESKDCK